MPRWRLAVGALAPLPATGVVVLLHGRGAPGTVLLLAAVAFAYLFAGQLAGVAALTLAVALYGLVVLPIRGTIQVWSWDALGFVATFTLAGAGLMALLGRLRAASELSDRAREVAERHAAELAERIELIGPMLDAAPIGFALLDSQLRYQYVNNRLAEINGRPVADHIGRRPTELFGPDIGELAEAPLQAVLDTGESSADTPLSAVVDGRQRHFIGGQRPVRDSEGRAVAVIATLLDVTDQVATERALVRTAAELTATIESSPYAIALVDTDLRYQHANQAYRTLCGLADDPTGEDLAVGALPGGVLDGCRRALREGRPIDAETTVTADAASRDFTVNCYPVRLDSDVVGVAVIIVDVTARRRLAQLELEAASLRATAEIAFKLEEAQRLAGFASWDYDMATGQVTFSRQLDDIIGVTLPPGASMASVGAGVHPDDVARVQAARDRLRDTHAPFTIEYRLIRPDGRVLDVVATGEAVRDGAGRVVRLWGTIQDVTEQRAAERSARDSARHAEQARADLEVEHQALQMFQRAMLPAELPRLDAVDLSAVYLPVAERIDIGGDWYDAFRLPDGGLALAVGDVTGHDLRAATVMGQVRNAVRAYATEHPRPGEVLARVNTLLARLPDLDLVTMLFGVYYPASHELLWSNAGHPPPLLRRGHEVTTLNMPGGLLLGVVPDGGPYPEHRLALAPGDTVLWYTDGIIDHRAIDPTVAMQRLAESFARACGDVVELLGKVSTDLLSGGEREDDVCLLALRRAAGPVAPTPGSREARPDRPEESTRPGGRSAAAGGDPSTGAVTALGPTSRRGRVITDLSAIRR